MVQGSRWGHTKITLERPSRSERQKELQELGKQEDTFNKILDTLKQNARREINKDSNDNG
jgi:hypothetical protein